MKNKILGVLVVAGIALLTTLNVSLTGTENSSNNLTLDIAQQKASAEDELDEIVVTGYTDDNDFMDFLEFLGSDPYFDDLIQQCQYYEDAPGNPISQWWSQGLHKDESSFIRPCPSSSSSTTRTCIRYDDAGACIEYSETQTNAPDRKEVQCCEGAANCTVVGC
jgi:hypothetical protein